jgi:transcription initiation factor TFIIIB Brf1 subunit/transcription initiation factor TFIIB
VLEQIFSGAMEVHRDAPTAKEYFIREEIMETCARLHLDNSIVVEGAVDLFKELKPSMSYRCEKDRELCAYAIWETLNRLGMPRDPKHISDACDVNSSYIFKIQKSRMLSSTYCEPESFVQIVCDELYLPFSITRMVIKLASSVQDCYVANPQVVVAASLIVTIQEVRKSKKIPTLYPHVSLKLCQNKSNPPMFSVFYASESAVRKLVKRIRSNTFIDISSCSLKVGVYDHHT